jgi:hypothetical protein
MTAFGLVCEKLGIQIISAHSPRPRVGWSASMGSTKIGL